jgi:hypothetical protein
MPSPLLISARFRYDSLLIKVIVILAWCTITMSISATNGGISLLTDVELAYWEELAADNTVRFSVLRFTKHLEVHRDTSELRNIEPQSGFLYPVKDGQECVGINDIIQTGIYYADRQQLAILALYFGICDSEGHTNDDLVFNHLQLEGSAQNFLAADNVYEAKEVYYDSHLNIKILEEYTKDKNTLIKYTFDDLNSKLDARRFVFKGVDSDSEAFMLVLPVYLATSVQTGYREVIQVRNASVLRELFDEHPGLKVSESLTVETYEEN